MGSLWGPYGKACVAAVLPARKVVAPGVPMVSLWCSPGFGSLSGPDPFIIPTGDMGTLWGTIPIFSLYWDNYSYLVFAKDDNQEDVQDKDKVELQFGSPRQSREQILKKLDDVHE